MILRAPRVRILSVLLTAASAWACGGGGGGGGGGVVDTPPDLSVTKTANPTSVPETGGMVTFTITVANTTGEQVTITQALDSVFNLADPGRCPALVGTALASGGMTNCVFNENLMGTAGTPHQNTVTVTVADSAGQTGQRSAMATVNFTLVLSPDFMAGNSMPMANTISMQPGMVNNNDFDVIIQVTNINNFYGAGFVVTYDDASTDFLGATQGALLPMMGVEFDVAEIVPPTMPGRGEIEIVASLQGDVVGIPNATGELLTLHFTAAANATGVGFDFGSPLLRQVKTCAVAGQPCSDVAAGLTWSGGTLDVN